METHVLNGDALLANFPFADRVIVCREGLIDGPVNGTSIGAFWRMRSEYICSEYGGKPEDYLEKVKAEFDMVPDPGSLDPLNLWFEHDLFCQVNMWFTLYYLNERGIESPVYRVMPPATGDRVWAGFGFMDEFELRRCYSQRLELSGQDRSLGVSLWLAYAHADLDRLITLSKTGSEAFPLLSSICQAHVERFPDNGSGRPQRRLREIVDSGVDSFEEIFRQFAATEGIYGFGDVQVMRMLSALK